MAEEEFETTLLVVGNVYVYRIPPRPSAQGYKAADWPDESLIWQGRLLIVERGDLAIIRLVHTQNGETFAECPVHPGSVEPVLDSSRYFVLRVEDRATKRHAFLGMGFQERGEAFDFNAALQDHDRRVEDAKQIASRAAQAGPAVDYSLHAGQTIHVELKANPAVTPTGKTSTSSTQARSVGSGGVQFASNGGLLPPPPGSRSRARAAPTTAASSNPWGDFTSAPAASSTSTSSTSFFN